MAKRSGDKKKEDYVAVAIDKDKSSQHALKWTVDHLLSRGQTLTLLHVKQKTSSIPTPSGTQVSIKDVNEEVARTYTRQLDNQAREMFLPFRCFCTRKEIKCNEVLLDGMDISKAIIEYVTANAIEILVLGASTKAGIVRKFRATDVPGNVSKGAPEFCTVYIISKGKIASVRSASAPPPPRTSFQAQLQSHTSNISDIVELPLKPGRAPRGAERSPYQQQAFHEEMEMKSPFTIRSGLGKYEPSFQDSDISFVSSGRPSTDQMFPPFHDGLETGIAPWLSNGSDYDLRSFGSSYSGSKFIDTGSHNNFSFTSEDSERSFSSHSTDDMEAEMRRLRQELKQTMEMYGSACKEALTAKQKTRDLQRWKFEEEQRIEEFRLAENAALALVAKEKAKCKVAIEAAEAAKKMAEMELQKRIIAEKMGKREPGEKNATESIANHDMHYRKYTIEEIEAATNKFSNSFKIGEGGYGPVYKGYLDHTPVAIKVLRPDAAHGRAQFQQEVEVLSCIRHPNMVLLLGACPEYGCLVYEHLANGSLEDRLFRRGNTPPLSWQLRFRIAAEIGTGLLFLHQTKPEPLVHRDLKPGNILLDRNFVSKISDVGLARLVPPSVANHVTQYRMTATAGTFFYIDPEYQQTGMLGIKSDIYSLGVMFLQLITAKPPMGLSHHVEMAIEMGTFAQMLDPAVPDWPVKEALSFAKLALKCAELRKKDRPDLKSVILPELNRLRELAGETTPNIIFASSTETSPIHSQSSLMQDVLSHSELQSGYESPSIPSSSSYQGTR